MSAVPASIPSALTSGVVPALLVVILGVALWAAGRRILRPGLAIMGALAGGAVGWAAGEIIDLGFSSLILAAGGALMMALIAWTASRIAVAGAMAALLAALAPVCVWLAHQQGWYRPTADAALTAPEKRGGLYYFDDDGTVENAPAEPLPSLPAPAGDRSDEGGGLSSAPPFENLQAAVKEKLDSISSALEQARNATEFFPPGEPPASGMGATAGGLHTAARPWIDRAQQAWDEVPDDLRPSLLGAAIIGALAGFVLGLAWRSLGAMMITAAAGAALMLAGVSKTLPLLAMGEDLWRPAAPEHWLGLWLITALLGVAIQWTLRPRSADKPA
jgi:hypothetical protein